MSQSKREKEKERLTKKYLKFQSGTEKGQSRTHLPSADLHMRRQRLARMNKLSPDVLRVLRADVRKEILGDNIASALDYAKRNMACIIVFTLLQRYLSKQKNKAFYSWKHSKLCISCLRRERLLIQAQEEKDRVAEEHRKDTIKRIVRRYLQKASIVSAFKVWKDDSKDFAQREQRKRRALKWFTNRKFIMVSLKAKKLQ